MVTCPLAPGVSRLISGFCSSPRDFALDFLQTPPRDDALALWLTFGSAKTWYRDFHPTSFVPCTAHTSEFTRLRGVSRRSGGMMGWTKPLRGGSGNKRLHSKCSLIPSPEGLFHNKP